MKIIKQNRNIRTSALWMKNELKSLTLKNYYYVVSLEKLGLEIKVLSPSCLTIYAKILTMLAMHLFDH